MRALIFALALTLVASDEVMAAYSAPFPARAHWAQNGDTGVMVLGPRAMSVLRMDGTVAAAVPTDEDISLVELSRDGSHIAFATPTKVRIIRPDGTEAASLPANSCLALRWSADGTRLLYTSLEDGASAGQKRLIVRLVDADGQNKRDILSQSYASP
jgi:hypothetical protein